eukprot:GHUV01035108.1.p1 GENE.GHUV01035108.1~~GHUV01035108.1.p1  ORF type:complete len:119 (-),score=12.40 GHUV01035108.1:1097-1453(-)
MCRQVLHVVLITRRATSYAHPTEQVIEVNSCERRVKSEARATSAGRRANGNLTSGQRWQGSRTRLPDVHACTSSTSHRRAAGLGCFCLRLSPRPLLLCVTGSAFHGSSGFFVLSLAMT